MRSFDCLHLIPNWRFFAPIPAKKDYHLEYRLKLGESNTTRWERIELVAQRNFWSMFWYPSKRLRKAFNTSVRRIKRRLSDSGFDSASRSVSYLHLLNYLQNSVLINNAKALQFRIISQQDFAKNRKPRLVFTSDWHIQ